MPAMAPLGIRVNHCLMVVKWFLYQGHLELSDLRVPPGNHLEKLKGDWAGFHSIRVNDQWRLCFKWTSQGPAEVQLVDYHR